MSYEIFGNRGLARTLWFLAVISSIGQMTALLAMPPYPDSLETLCREDRPLPYYLENRPQLLARGVNAPSMRIAKAASGAGPGGSFKALAVLVKFTDKAASVNPADFDTLIFENQPGTVRHYYNTISSGQLDIVSVNLPSTLGWIQAPQTYAYYCNNANGTGPYPHNTQKLAEDVVDLINPVIDFSQYDNDGDGYVDALILIHTGPGAELTRENYDIWSHKWSIYPRLRDGVYISDYCIQPEYWVAPGDITCGVFCHELGHVFGLPDLYDTDYSSRGIGCWSIMSYGSWGGSMGNCPSEPDAWSRIRLGFASAVNVTANASGNSIAAIETGGSIYRLWSNGAVGNEYFLIENRQKTGYDSYLPAGGILVWHIDSTRVLSFAPNDNEWYPGHETYGNFGVALEQADGLFSMEKNANAGDEGDPFPGVTNKRSFSTLTTPNSNAYNGENTYVAVNNISNSAMVMTVDFQVSLISDAGDVREDPLPAKIALSQNYPNPFNPATNMDISLPSAGKVTLTVYDILGRTVAELVDGYYPSGNFHISWNGRDRFGGEAPSGVYFYELRTDREKEKKKMVLIR
jgi:immune inhibitor A